jgi:hypothetical protein
LVVAFFEAMKHGRSSWFLGDLLAWGQREKIISGARGLQCPFLNVTVQF